jgi:penicillin amidase
VDRDHKGRERALRWTAHEPTAVNMRLLPLEEARDLSEAFAIANDSGGPPQNFVAADTAGHIGWTIIGRIPKRAGFDGRLPESWADGSRRWDGWVDPGAYPRLVDPPGGRLWTANGRTVDGPWLQLLGHGMYEHGARPRQIRDALLSVDKATPRDMLRVQLDDRAIFLERWQQLLLRTLDAQAVAASPRRAEMRSLVERWGGRASADSAGYRLVRRFRKAVADEALPALVEPCRAADDRFDWPRRFPQLEGPLWALVSERPEHLLDRRHGSWDALLLAAVDRTLESLPPGPLAERTWGEENTLAGRHPLSRAVPALSRWLDLPAQPLPGGTHMPRVQTPVEGASERFVVSPGHEEHGLFHMPGGQSGHFLSPFYRAGHAAWVAGEPTPLLPGAPRHELVLTP